MKQLYILFLLCIMLCSCNSFNNQQQDTLNNFPQVATLHIQDGDTLHVADLNLFRKEIMTIPLSELLEDFEIIKLDDRPDALVKSGMTFITDDYIGFGECNFPSSLPYKLFDRQGKFVSIIGSIGQGPGEYTSLYTHHIDKNGWIYILPWNATSILCYDSDGNNCLSIPLPYRVPKGIMYVDGEKERVFMGLLPFTDSNIDAVFWEQDFQGNIIHEIEPGHLSTDPDFSNEVVSSKNTDKKDFYIFYWVTRQDSLYHYDDIQKKLKPVFTIDFKGNLPMHTYAELPNYYLANITTEFIQMGNMTQAELPEYEIIIDKNSLKGTYYRLVNDYLGNMPLENPMAYFQNGYFVMNMDPGELQEQLENHLFNSSKMNAKNKASLTKIYNSISPENDNNYLLIGKLKTQSHSIQFLTGKEKTLSSNIEIEETIEPISITEDILMDEDTTIWDSNNMPHFTASLTNWKTYFPANNKFKDWPKEDEKMVVIEAIIEKSGKATHVRVGKSSEVSKLDAEAIRLIEEAPIEPAQDESGNPLRSRFVIPVYFPPR